MAGNIKRIVLAGGGHAHLGVLHAWAKAPPPDTQRILVTSSRYTAYSGMLPGWMAGIYSQDQMLVDLAPLAAAAGVELLIAEVTGLDADAGRLLLSTGAQLEFDLLSLAIGGIIDTVPLAATGARLLPVRPVEAFMAGWQAALTGPRSGAEYDVAVVGGGAGGFELACAAQAAFHHKYGAGRVALVAARGQLLAGHARAVTGAGRTALIERGITLIEANASGHAQGLALPGGEILSAGLVIAA
ncbi:FAD-dependent oxidoreductase, partial [Sandarakinorhabdus oryzae]|uniref:FAD-dependent oxidoreductase n=1 Tax=Sandarakinorhabdus oryzae TaxID=2675220 RepID=UPI0018CC4899